jgi:hypothetical protein
MGLDNKDKKEQFFRVEEGRGIRRFLFYLLLLYVHLNSLSLGYVLLKESTALPSLPFFAPHALGRPAIVINVTQK